jgi:polyhydroxyalkanoate synthase
MAEGSAKNPAAPTGATTGTMPEDWAAIMAGIADRSSRLVQDFMTRTGANPTQATGMGMSDSMNIAGAFMELMTKMMGDPSKLMDAQVTLWRDYMNLWRSTTLRMMGEAAPAVIEPTKDDRRFKDDAWRDLQVFDFIKQSYLLTSRWMQSTVGEVEGLDPQTKRKVDFFTKQFTDALAPTNFAATNPEVLRATAESKGENLIKGLQNLLEDLEKGKGKLRVSMTDETAFKVGVNVAVTPGKVVAETRLMQLIQYAPTTDKVKEVPVIIIPPWINKFYILDLREKNSLVKWLTDQGYTTFIMSWVNPDETMAEVNFEDYMLEGAIAAKDAALAATGAAQVHMVGYCLGGTLLSATASYLKAKKDDTLASVTLLAAMTDFKEVGDLRVFIDEEQVQRLEQRMEDAGGYLDAADMATTFNMLRSNDLIWSFVVSNYLLGKEPFPFDLLYWNSDSTRMPKAMHSFYLRNMYLENNLAKPGGITLAGQPIDLGKVDLPVYMISCKEDHIAPWAGTYEGTRLFGGKVRFVLSASGHIAGIVNPPAANKYCYWTNDKLAKTASAWFAAAKEQPGSWWTDWEAWIAPMSGKMVKARQPGDGKLKAIEDAPGRYVRARAV